MSREKIKLKEPPQPIVVAAFAFAVGVYAGSYYDIEIWMVLLALGLYAVCRYKYLILLIIAMVGALDASLQHDTDERPYTEHHTESSVQQWLSERLDRLEMNSESEGLSKALVLGDRASISWDMTQSYRRSGAAHLLAVSGLHIGIVLLIFGFLIRPMVLLPWGNIWYLLSLLALIWGYVVMVGAGASVVRAGIMFSVVTLSHLSLRSYSSINALAGTVLVMLLVDPSTLFDIGFQLSVVSVSAILLWALPLWRVMKRWRWCRSVGAQFVVLPILIGAMCTLATLPIVSHTFGYFSLWGIVLNPLVILTTYLTIASSIVWCIASVIPGVELLSPLFRWVIEGCVMLQNGAIEWMASGWRDALDIRIESSSVLLIYLCYFLVSWGCKALKISHTQIEQPYEM